MAHCLCHVACPIRTTASVIRRRESLRHRHPMHEETLRPPFLPMISARRPGLTDTVLTDRILHHSGGQLECDRSDSADPFCSYRQAPERVVWESCVGELCVVLIPTSKYSYYHHILIIPTTTMNMMKGSHSGGASGSGKREAQAPSSLRRPINLDCRHV